MIMQGVFYEMNIIEDVRYFLDGIAGMFYYVNVVENAFLLCGYCCSDIL